MIYNDPAYKLPPLDAYLARNVHCKVKTGYFITEAVIQKRLDTLNLLKPLILERVRKQPELYDVAAFEKAFETFSTDALASLGKSEMPASFSDAALKPYFQELRQEVNNPSIKNGASSDHYPTLYNYVSQTASNPTPQNIFRIKRYLTTYAISNADQITTLLQEIENRLPASAKSDTQRTIIDVRAREAFLNALNRFEHEQVYLLLHREFPALSSNTGVDLSNLFSEMFNTKYQAIAADGNNDSAMQELNKQVKLLKMFPPVSSYGKSHGLYDFLYSLNHMAQMEMVTELTFKHELENNQSLKETFAEFNALQAAIGGPSVLNRVIEHTQEIASALKNQWEQSENKGRPF